MKNVLVLTDFSPHARHALKHVIELMQDIQVPCHLLLINAYQLPEYPYHEDIIFAHDQVKRASLLGLKQEMDCVNSMLKNSNLTLETGTFLGPVKNIVAQILKKQKFDLVVMGRSGGRNMQYIDEVLQETGCSLLTSYYHSKEMFLRTVGAGA